MHKTKLHVHFEALLLGIANSSTIIQNFVALHSCRCFTDFYPWLAFLWAEWELLWSPMLYLTSIMANFTQMQEKTAIWQNTNNWQYHPAWLKYLTQLVIHVATKSTKDAYNTHRSDTTGNILRTVPDLLSSVSLLAMDLLPVAVLTSLTKTQTLTYSLYHILHLTMRNDHIFNAFTKLY